MKNFAGLGNVSGEFAYQPGNRGRLFFIRSDAPKLLQQIDVGVALKDVRVLVFLKDLWLFALVAYFAHDLFDQIFNGNHADDAAVLVNHNGHADVVALHLAQQFAAQLGFGNEVHIGLHQVAHRLAVRLNIGYLQQVLGINDALDVIDIAFVHGNARVRMFPHQIGKFGDGHAGWRGDDLGTRRHYLTHRLVAKLDHRLNEIAVALLQDSFFLTRFDQRVNRFRRMLRLLVGVFLGERCDRKRKTENQRNRQRQIDEPAQHGNPVPQPLAPGAHEKYIGQQAIEDHDDEAQADRRLHQVKHDPELFHEHHIADKHADAGHADLRQHRHRQRRPLPAHVEARLDLLLVSVDVFLKLARQKLAHLGVQAVNV